MNLEKLFAWIAGIVLVFTLTGHLDDLQRWIWRAQAKVIYESRASAWGTPNIWGKEKSNSKQSLNLTNKSKNPYNHGGLGD